MNGQTVSRTPHFALHRVALQPNSEPSSAPKAAANSQEMASQAGSQDLSKPLFAVQDTWLGVIVPKRWAKRAVTRNTIKRQIYAVSTASGCAMPVAAHVVRLRAGFDRAEFVSATSDKLKIAIRAELQQLFSGAKQ